MKILRFNALSSFITRGDYGSSKPSFINQIRKRKRAKSYYQRALSIRGRKK